MISLVKSFIGLVLLGGLAYGAFFIDLGGETLAGHFADIWTSPVVQEKVDRVKEGVTRDIEERLAQAAENAGRDAAREALGSGEQPEEIAEEDRQALNDVIGRATGAAEN